MAGSASSIPTVTEWPLERLSRSLLGRLRDRSVGDLGEDWRQEDVRRLRDRSDLHVDVIAKVLEPLDTSLLATFERYGRGGRVPRERVGAASMSGAVWNGRSAIRFSVSNWRTSERNLERALDAFEAASVKV